MDPQPSGLDISTMPTLQELNAFLALSKAPANFKQAQNRIVCRTSTEAALHTGIPPFAARTELWGSMPVVASTARRRTGFRRPSGP